MNTSSSSSSSHVSSTTASSADVVSSSSSSRAAAISAAAIGSLSSGASDTQSTAAESLLASSTPIHAPTQFQPSTAAEFHGAITGARDAGYAQGTETDSNSKWHGQKVHVYDVSEYNKMRLFLLPDRSAGFAIKGENEIVSIFKHPTSYNETVMRKKAMELIMEKAIEQGGRRLDCFEPMLPRYYARFGFRPVARTKFDKEFAPDKWNYGRDGQPDIVFMIHDPTQKAATDLAVAASRYESQVATIPYTSYDSGMNIQLVALKRG